MIVITGATGALNGATVDHLLQRMPAEDITVVTRAVEKAGRFADLGIAVRQGDYAEPTSLPDAFAGADQLLLVSSNDPAGDHVALHRNAIRAAKTVGVGRILYTSHQGAAVGSPFGPGDSHARTEHLLAYSGTPWTSLRNGFYAHSLSWLAGPWRETGVISVPADGPVSWTSRDDAAEAAAVILASNGKYDGPTTLTAPAAPTFEQLAEIASLATGRDIRFQLLDTDDWVAAQVAGGMKEVYARFMLGMYEAAHDGFFAGTDPLLATLLGREPHSAADALLSTASH
jgi:NAD(P)H dehydrogenase (quinone)